MKKRFTMFIMAIAMVGCAEKAQNEVCDEFISDGKWHEIDAEKIPGNFVQHMNDAMLLTAGDSANFNTMTIGWGEIGKLWGRPVVTVYVSTSRYTCEFMESNEYFTVTGFPEEYKGNVMYMGKKSGRDENKVVNGGLTAEFTDLGNAIFSEANLAIECRKIYRAELDTTAAPTDMKGLYQQIGPHIMYVGEIVKTYRK
ncbi:MAG: flavin reductase [Bacteroidales bacterium]|nr:flavin reductase [Bacteroidales bacterium]